ATTTSVWNRPHGSRSRRAGMVVFTSGAKFLALITTLSATAQPILRQPLKLAARRFVIVEPGKCLHHRLQACGCNSDGKISQAEFNNACKLGLVQSASNSNMPNPQAQ